MIIYLVKASACVALFYLVYLALFRTTNHFHLNRAFLLSGLVLSFVIPLLVLQATPIDNVSIIVMQGNAAMDNLNVADLTASIGTNHQVISNIYFSGVAISLLITLVSVVKPLRLYWAADKIVRDNHVVIIHPNAQPCSFFGVLFIRSHDEEPIIIAHEMVHIRQRHWIDLAVMEVAGVILWFNPVIHFYKRSIAIQHEYIADREVIARVPVEDYLDCIAKQLESTMRPGLVNNFNSRSIKQRIIMATSTNHYRVFRYAITLPVVAILVMSFATRKTTDVLVIQNRELRSPVDVSKLKRGEGAGFGTRFNPATNSEAFHTGVDFVLATGNSVYATAPGVIVKAENSGSYGNLVIIEHNKKLSTSSAHLERILVKAGDKVEAGQLIGTVGSTGKSTGPHLHFEVLENGRAVDPVPYLNMEID